MQETAAGGGEVGEAARGAATLLLLRLCGGGEEGVDALLRTGGLAVALTELLAPVIFDGGGAGEYGAALSLLNYDVTAGSGVGLPPVSLPEPSAYAALLQVARAVMRDRLLRLVDTLRWPSSEGNGDGGGGKEAGAVEDWVVVEIVEACGALVEAVTRHAPLATEVAELNGVQALLRLLDGGVQVTRVVDAATRALGQLCALNPSVVAMVAAAGKGDLPLPVNERPLDHAFGHAFGAQFSIGSVGDYGLFGLTLVYHQRSSLPPKRRRSRSRRTSSICCENTRNPPPQPDLQGGGGLTRCACDDRTAALSELSSLELGDDNSETSRGSTVRSFGFEDAEAEAESSGGGSPASFKTDVQRELASRGMDGGALVSNGGAGVGAVEAVEAAVAEAQVLLAALSSDTVLLQADASRRVRCSHLQTSSTRHDGPTTYTEYTEGNDQDGEDLAVRLEALDVIAYAVPTSFVFQRHPTESL